jgi:hypothetical protein
VKNLRMRSGDSGLLQLSRTERDGSPYLEKRVLEPRFSPLQRQLRNERGFLHSKQWGIKNT